MRTILNTPLLNKTTIILIWGLVWTINQAFGQEFKHQFHELLSENDTLGQATLLQEWEKAHPNDPEMFVAYYNYYLNKSRKDGIAIGENPKGKDGFQLTDPESADKNPVGYIYGDTRYDTNVLQKGFDYISKGIEKYPDRLDMRFGKIYMLGEIEDFESFTSEIIKTIQHSAVNNNKWTWEDDEPLDNAQEQMFSSLQGYFVQLYNMGSEELLRYMKEIPETILNYYPAHVESLSNLSIVYILQKDLDSALTYLLKAEEVDPTDTIVLSNIAQIYRLKKDTDKAVHYYELMLQHGDQETKDFAKSQIETLKKD